MEHTVINRILIIFLLFIGLKSAAQQTGPLFIYKSESNNHLSRLDYFLGTFEPVKLENCLFASGTFRFKISKEGKICNFEITGDLPDSLALSIRKRIFQTEGHWESFTLTENSSKWFVFPVFIGRKLTSDCAPIKSVEEAYSLLYKLFGGNKIISTPTSYLIFPVYLFGAI